ncbi:DUF3795 domain-containing protein [Desulfopila aestuarii]|uniref:DUF3795 domain-containing protein n=1 Tax=Desulfopila aestuarii DSM 18488 TaxID=1121416 RepID=A0A1M7Y7G0_9BACT|nr:DUF3795 domain-containing protein [Desulfopila aestuarii]SHO48448.1 Protein of unknown function [Desulfopila aestuarii DSM 18488]
MNYTITTAPCGIDCFNCLLFVDMQQSNERKAFNERHPQMSGLNCQGCRQQNCPMLSGPCKTRQCVEDREIEFCHECADFPCALLAPVADQAGKFPHNMKVYNLCRIKSVGVDQWAREEATTIRTRYFTGTFQIGVGQEGEATTKE